MKSQKDTSVLTEDVIGLLKMIIRDDHEIVTIIEGNDCPKEVTTNLLAWLSVEKPEIDVEVHKCGQPLYPYYFGIE